MESWKIWIIGVAVVAVLGGAVYSQTYSYEKFHVQDFQADHVCEEYYESCYCIGTLAVMESYPPQYDCNGYSSCTPINKTICN